LILVWSLKLKFMCKCDIEVVDVQIRNEFYTDTQGALLVYDVTNRSSFDALDVWLDEIRQDIGSSADFDNVIFIVCANKVCTML